MTAPLVSILMPVKTGWEYMPESVRSVVDQTFRDWELLIGVNGHPRDSEPYKEARQWEDDQIVALDLHNAGSKLQAMRRMLSVADGQYIAILDVDDLWEPVKLQKQVPWMEKYDVVGTGATYFGQQQGQLPVACGEITFEMLLETNHVVNSSVLMRRDCCQWTDQFMLDDYPLWLQLTLDGKRILNLPHILTRIRTHPGQHYAGKDDAPRVQAYYRTLRKR